MHYELLVYFISVGKIRILDSVLCGNDILRPGAEAQDNSSGNIFVLTALSQPAIIVIHLINKIGFMLRP